MFLSVPSTVFGRNPAIEFTATVVSGLTIAGIATALFVGFASAQSVLHVDGDASPGGDGSSWETAYTNLFVALDAAGNDEMVDQIWVAEGIYTPDRGQGDREDTFEMVDGVSLYGGFAGNETSLDDRVPGAHSTILSGDFDGNDVVVPPTGQGRGEIPDLPEFQNYDENAHHVVSGRDLTMPTRVDGFTIRGGNADFDGDAFTGGAGMILERSNASVSDCVFEFNRCGLEEPDVGGFGGALFLRVGDYEITDCLFLTNRGMNGGAMGIYSPGETQPVTARIAGCEFDGNFAEQQTGGAIWSASVLDLVVIDCIFRDNFAQYGGAIIDSEPRQPASKTFLGCRFVGNRSLVQAGAVWHWRTTAEPDSEMALFQDCYFEDNSTSGGVGGGILFWSADAAVIRSHFVNNSGVFGGGLCQVQSPIHSRAGDLDVFGSLFHGNEAQHGGAVFASRCDELRIGSNTFTQNSVTGTGGAVHFNQGAAAAAVSNNILWNNDAAGGQTEEDQIIGQPRNMTFCLVQGLVDPGQGNIDGDPMFTDPSTLDFRVGMGSIAIDAGTNALVPADVGDLDEDGDRLEPLPLDFAGNPRFVDDPQTVDTGMGTPPLVDIGAFEFPGDVTSVSALPDPSAPFRMRALENPARGTVEFALQSPVVGKVAVQIFDVRGRQVRRLSEDSRGTDPVEFRWDGNDEQGRPCRSGVYLARAATPGAQAGLKLTLLR